MLYNSIVCVNVNFVSSATHTLYSRIIFALFAGVASGSVVPHTHVHFLTYIEGSLASTTSHSVRLVSTDRAFVNRGGRMHFSLSHYCDF